MGILKMPLVKLSDVFDISYGHKLDLNKMSMALNESEGFAFINRTAKNNGVVAIVKKINNLTPAPAGAITVALGGSVLSSFVQIKPFYTGQNVAIALPRLDLTLAQKLFYTVAIHANRFRYSTCGREANRTFKSMLVPSLDDIPAWVNDLDASLYDGADKPALESLPPVFNANTWHKFQLQDLFNIERGRGPRRKDLDGSGSIPFVSSSDSNNGLTGYTTMPPIHKGNTIGVNRNGSVGEAFYQPEPFCSTEDVHIFNPKPFWQARMNAEIGLFMATLIRQEKYRFNYGRKWGIERMKISTIPLPVKADSSPDFDFMENYIKTLPYSSQIQNN